MKSKKDKTPKLDVSDEETIKANLKAMDYPPSEDIMRKDKRVQPEEEEDDDPAGDLDIPGAELDDDGERIGEEDEENNYYSLGGDEKNELEEGQE